MDSSAYTALGPGSGLERIVIFHRTNLTLADFAMSTDIRGVG